MKGWLTLISVIVLVWLGLAALEFFDVGSPLPFSVLPSAQSLPQFNFYYLNTHTKSPQYNVGSRVLEFSEPVYSCQVRKDFTGFIDFDSNKACWDIYFNNAKTKFGQNYDFSSEGFVLENRQASAQLFCDKGSCRFEHPQKDFYARYNVRFLPNSSKLEVLGAPIFSLGEEGFVDVKVTTILPTDTNFGVGVSVEERIVQSSYSFNVDQKVSSNSFTFRVPLRFSTIGEKTVSVQPYVETWDYRKSFVANGERCVQNEKTLESYCLQKTRVAVGDKVSFKVYASPDKCFSDFECGGSFSCENNVCVLKSQPESVQQVSFGTLWEKIVLKFNQFIGWFI